MKQTVIQQAIEIVRKRIDSMNDTLMDKHTAHHLQQVERELWVLLKEEKEQIMRTAWHCHIEGVRQVSKTSQEYIEYAEQYYKETYKSK
jgi:hypothetical protein